MKLSATSRGVTISARKVRIVADTIHNISVARALSLLSIERKRGAGALLKTLKSASANAVNNAKANEDSLFISSVEVTDGPALKRFHASTRGRVHPYKRRTSHIRITLAEKGGTKSN